MNKVKLGDIANITKLAGFEHTEYIQNNCSHQPKDNFIPLFIGKTISNGSIDKNFDWYISKEISNLLPRSKLDKKCLIVPYVGSVGDIAIFDGSYEAHLGSNVAKIEIVKKELYSENFLYYYIKSPIGQKRLLRDLQGGVQKNITMGAIRDIELPNVPLTEQEKMVAPLIVIDKKIQNNKKQIETLENLAKTIYDYWFVQFDFPNEEGKPYKSSGGKMVWNEELKREIPEGWLIQEIAQYIKIVRGVSYKPNDVSNFPKENYVPLLKSNNLQNDKLVLNELIYVPKHFVSESQFLNNNSIFVTMSSGSSEHVGKTAIIPYDTPYSYGAFCSKIDIQREYRCYVSCFFISDYFKRLIRTITVGTSIKNINNEHLTSNKIVISPDNLIFQKFEGKINPIFDKIGEIVRENIHLSEIKDFLLPILINGQVKIKK